MWNNTQIKQHVEAAEHLTAIQRELFQHLKQTTKTTEYEIQQLILRKFIERRMTTDHPPIVAFNASAAKPHYFPKKNSKQFSNNTLVLIDIWARMNKRKAPFADITWVGYKGKPPQQLNNIYETVIKARDNALRLITKNLLKKRIPTGKEINDEANRTIINAGYKKYLKHRTGHCIGTTSPHGLWKNLTETNHDPLKKNLGYTIEPGIYIDGKYGIRSEIDFYIHNNKLILTTKKQTKLLKI